MSKNSLLTHNEFLNNLLVANIKYVPIDEYKGRNKKIRFQCFNNPEHIFEAMPSNILNGTGCPYCARKKIFTGETDMATTDPEMASMLFDIELGKRLSSWSDEITDWVCPKCGNIITSRIHKVKQYGLKCSVCNDGISIPEKFLSSMLLQLEIKYKHDIPFKWSNKKRYDFYIPSMNIVIEAHGMQHYEKGFDSAGGKRTVDEEKSNDKYKMELALNNGINDYIVIDCRYSNMLYIKNSIISSKLNEIFDLSIVDFCKCWEMSQNSIIPEIALLYNKGEHITEIASKFNIHYGTVIKYLKRATDIGLCKYEQHKNAYRESKRIICVETRKIYNSISNVCEDGYDRSYVSNCCNNKCETAYGLHWQFI